MSKRFLDIDEFYKLDKLHRSKRILNDLYTNYYLAYTENPDVNPESFLEVKSKENYDDEIELPEGYSLQEETDELIDGQYYL